MIARHWRGLAKASEAQAYVEHLNAETFPLLRRLSGFMGASLLRRSVPGGVEFLVVTQWESLEAITAFAGADAEVAVVPLNVQAMMVEYDHRVSHYEVLESSPTSASGA